jgi:hypothetical protein
MIGKDRGFDLRATERLNVDDRNIDEMGLKKLISEDVRGPLKFNKE